MRHYLEKPRLADLPEKCSFDTPLSTCSPTVPAFVYHDLDCASLISRRAQKVIVVGWMQVRGPGSNPTAQSTHPFHQVRTPVTGSVKLSTLPDTKFRELIHQKTMDAAVGTLSGMTRLQLGSAITVWRSFRYLALSDTIQTNTESRYSGKVWPDTADCQVFFLLRQRYGGDGAH